MIWETLTYEQIDILDRNLPVILNLAAIEQHGPHLPINTDAIIGQLFLDKLEEKNPKSHLILPQVKICCSAHHLDYSGTLSVSHMVLKDYVIGILNSVVQAGFKKIILFNSHGGNQAIGQVIVEEFGAKNEDCFISLITWWRLIREDLLKLSETEKFGAGHACELETSLLMAANVIDEKAIIPKGEYFVPLFDWCDGSMLHGAKTSVYRSMQSISGGSGTVGQPDAASYCKGKKIIEHVVTALEKIVDDVFLHAHKTNRIGNING